MSIETWYHTTDYIETDGYRSEPKYSDYINNWLGEGYYFWELENNAIKWAEFSYKKKHKRVQFCLYEAKLDLEFVFDISKRENITGFKKLFNHYYKEVLASPGAKSNKTVYYAIMQKVRNVLISNHNIKGLICCDHPYNKYDDLDFKEDKINDFLNSINSRYQACIFEKEVILEFNNKQIVSNK